MARRVTPASEARQSVLASERVPFYRGGVIIDHDDTLMALVEAEWAGDASLLQFRSLTSARQYRRAHRLVAQYVSPGKAVLDWGAGNGHFSFFLVRSGYQVSGFGFEKLPGLCSGFNAGEYEYRQGSPRDPRVIPFDNESFDAVMSVGVLEHVRETGGEELASLGEIHRMLKPGGLFLCFHLPNRYSWIEPLSRRAGRHYHRFRFTAAEVRTLADAAGFDVLELRRYGVLPRNLWGSARLRRVGNCWAVAALYDALDAMLSVVLSPVCQNYLFVGRKRIKA